MIVRETEYDSNLVVVSETVYASCDECQETRELLDTPGAALEDALGSGWRWMTSSAFLAGDHELVCDKCADRCTWLVDMTPGVDEPTPDEPAPVILPVPVPPATTLGF